MWPRTVACPASLEYHPPMGHFFLILFLLGILVTVALAVLLAFLSHYADSRAIRSFVLFFLFIGAFLLFWFLSGYLSMNIGPAVFTWTLVMQTLAYLCVCAAEAVLANLVLRNSGTVPGGPSYSRAKIATGGFIVIGIVISTAKLSAFWDSSNSPVYYYAKWGSGSLLLLFALVLATVFLFKRSCFPGHVPSFFRRSLGAGLPVFTVSAAVDLYILPFRFQTGSFLPRSYPITAAVYLVFTILLIVQSLRSIQVYRSLLPLVSKTAAGMLTPREQEIAALVIQGRSNKAIADSLCIALPTVKNHLHNMYEKLEISSRMELIGRFRREK